MGRRKKESSSGAITALARTSIMTGRVWGEVAGFSRSQSGDEIIWGTQGGDEIIWGTRLYSQSGDEIIWGTSGGDEIIWGTNTDNAVLTRGEDR